MIDLHISLKDEDGDDNIFYIGEDEDVTIGRKELDQKDADVRCQLLSFKKIPFRDAVVAHVLSSSSVKLIPHDSKQEDGKRYEKNEKIEMNVGDVMYVSTEKTYRLTVHHSSLLDDADVRGDIEGPTKKNHSSMELYCLADYSQSLDSRVEENANCDDKQPTAKRPRVDSENKKDDLLEQQCCFIHEMLPAIPMEHIANTLKNTKSVDEAFSLLVEKTDESSGKDEVKDEAKISADVSNEEAIQFILEVLPECSKERALNALRKYNNPSDALTSLMDAEMTKDDASNRITSLMGAFPLLSPDLIRNVAESTTDYNKAFSMLIPYNRNEEEKRAKDKEVLRSESPLDKLITVFPGKEATYLQSVLDVCDSKVGETVNKVLSPALCFQPMIPGMALWAFRTAAGVPPCAAITDYKMKTAFDKTKFDLDTTKPCQSLLAFDCGDLKTHLFQSVFSPNREFKDTQHAMTCFEQMLKREQELHQDFVVFYHSYSYAHILYEVQSVVASILLGASDYCPPLPRLLFKPFDGIPSLDFLMEESLHSSDAGNKYRNCAICVSNSLFAYTSEAPPVSCFTQGYSVGHLNFRSLLIRLLIRIGIDKEASESTADSIFGSAKKNGLPGLEPMRMSDTGHMLQIFIKRTEVDSVAYDALPFGKYTHRGPISQLLTVKSSSLGPGQARVFVHPELMLDPNRSRTFYYSASAEFSKNRAAFRAEIKSILMKLFPTSESVKRASRKIRALPVGGVRRKKVEASTG